MIFKNKTLVISTMSILHEKLPKMWLEGQKPQSIETTRGTIRITYPDTDHTRLVIPLNQIEFIDMIALYLTFHMKSGNTHTIYVGDSYNLIFQKFEEYQAHLFGSSSAFIS